MGRQPWDKARLKESEEELLQGVVAKSREEAEAELEKEEALLRDAIVQSLEGKTNEEMERKKEEELLLYVMTQSLTEEAASKKKKKQDEEEQISRALALCQEKEKPDDKEPIVQCQERTQQDEKDPLFRALVPCPGE